MKDHDSNASDPLDPADPVNRDSVSDSWGRAAAYDAYADGLHTYALGGLRNHEAAASAVYCTFVAADHHVAHLGDAEMLRPWLYAIARHYCRAGKLPRMRLVPSAAAVPSGASSAAASRNKDTDKDRSMAELERSLLAAELSSLDWPDTDGLTAAHREVLELSVRHGMESRAVGLILGKPAAESFELLSAAWHELERSLAATALLRTSREHCPDLASLAQGWSGRLTAQRREPLVAHIDACSRCQFHLHKVLGAPQAPSILPHVSAPKELRDRVLGDLLDTSPRKVAQKAAIAGRLTSFDALGFPMSEAMVPPMAALPVEEGTDHGGTALITTADRRRRSSPGRDEAATTVMPAVRAGVFEDLRADRAVPGTAPPPRRNSVAAAIEGRRRGAADAKNAAGPGPRRPVGDAYEAVATVAAAVAAGDPAAHRVPRIAPARSTRPSPAPVRPDPTRVFTRPAPVPTRRRKSPFRSALASSAVVSGAGAAGVTAFVLFVPSSATSNQTLFTPPDPHGNSTQQPDYPRPSPASGAGSALPVAGGSQAGRPGGSEPGGDTVAAQVVAVVVPATPSSPASTPGGSAPPFGGPMNSLPPAISSGWPGESTSGSSGTGQLNISVTQRSNNPGQVTVTLWNSGTAPVSWTAEADAPWLTLSAVSGIIAPGAQTTMRITVDRGAEPRTAWQAHVRFDPSGQMVALSGSGRSGPPTSSPSSPPSTPGSTGGSSPSSTPTPSSPPSSSPGSPSTSPPSSTPSTPHSSPSPTPSSTPGGPGTSGPSSPPSTPPSTPSTSHSATQPSTTPTGTPSATGGNHTPPPGRRRRPTAP